MHIWTIQPAGLYETLKSRQVLFADRRRCFDRSAYHWMIDQMRRRLPPSRARFPWWGWYRWLGVDRPKPDLRAIGYLPAGQKGVRIELELDERKVLLSDLGGWQSVLNNLFLSYDEAEDEQFERERKKVGHGYGAPYPEPLKSKVFASWERIFDLTGGNPDWCGPVSERCIQATFWELRLRDVKDVTFYTDRGWRGS